MAAENAQSLVTIRALNARTVTKWAVSQNPFRKDNLVTDKALDTKVRCKQPIPSEEAPETGAGDDYGATAGNDYSAGGDDGGFVAQSSGDGEGW